MTSLIGLIPINKPTALTSKDVSRVLTPYLPKGTKLGHVGTLDPLADGVLPITIGRATRLQDYLHTHVKEYEAEVQLGVETDSLDCTGQILKHCTIPKFSKEDLLLCFQQFLGEITQTPPMHSAVKHKGKALYKFLSCPEKLNVPMEHFQRSVSIEKIKLLEWNHSSFRIQVQCSKGTYIRVLAADIAKALGTLGTITRLRRLQSAGINLTQCFELTEIIEDFAQNNYEKILLPTQFELGLPLIPFSTSQIKRFFNGLDVRFDSHLTSDAIRDVLVVDQHHSVLGIGQLNENNMIRIKRSLYDYAQS